jgi:hypothetical protein
MSFRTKPAVLASPFDVVRQSLSQQPGLPFSDVLTPADMQQVFDEEKVSFGERNPDESGGQSIVYSPAITLWAMLSQALLHDEQRSCRAAVARVAAYRAVAGQEACSTNTGAYCRARAKIPAVAVQRLAQQVACGCESEVPEEWRWLGRTVRLIDGTTLSMPATAKNLAEYPHARTQQEGLGFPILRMVALISLATGMVSAAAMGPYAGKETGETALFRQIFGELSAGEVVLADRYYCGWFMLALLQQLGIEFVVRLHQLRQADFSRGRRLGKGDHVVAWPKPSRPEWLDQQTYDTLSDELVVREVEVQVNIPGFRVQSLVVVSSLLDHQTCSKSELASLYRQRWLVELHLRDIKSALKLDILRSKTPQRVQQEIWTGLLAYNLVRQSLLQSARQAGCRPDQVSFTASLQLIASTWLLAATLHMTCRDETIVRLTSLRLTHGASHRVGHRPDRAEPRALKRRPNSHKLLTKPRNEARALLLTSRKP